MRAEQAAGLSRRDDLRRRLRETGGRGRKLRGIVELLRPYRTRTALMFMALVGDIERQFERAGLPDLLELARDLLAHLLRPKRVGENLDAGFIEIVAPSLLVVDAHDGLEECKDIALRDEIALYELGLPYHR